MNSFISDLFIQSSKKALTFIKSESIEFFTSLDRKLIRKSGWDFESWILGCELENEANIFFYRFLGKISKIKTIQHFEFSTCLLTTQQSPHWLTVEVTFSWKFVTCNFSFFKSNNTHRSQIGSYNYLNYYMKVI